MKQMLPEDSSTRCLLGRGSASPERCHREGAGSCHQASLFLSCALKIWGRSFPLLRDSVSPSTLKAPLLACQGCCENSVMDAECLTVLGRGCRGCRNVSHRGEFRSQGITVSVEWERNMVPSLFPSLTSSPLSLSSFLCGLWQRKPVRMGSAFLFSMVGCKHQPFCFLDRCVVCKQSKVSDTT